MNMMRAAEVAAAPLSREQIRAAHAAAAREIDHAQAPTAPTFGLALSMRYPMVSIHEMEAWEPAFDKLPYAEAMKSRCIAFRDGAHALHAVCSDPFAPELQDVVADALGASPTWYLAHRGDIEAYLMRHEDTLRAMDSVLSGAAAATHRDASTVDLSIQSISEYTSPVVKLVNSTLYDAMKVAASDIHLETGAGAMTIKYRIDGVLSSVATIPGAEQAEQVISRIKVMSELDIAERRVPQDGRFKVSVRGREIDVRVSVMPSIFGEDAVLRVLDKQALADEVRGLCLDHLGFDAASMRTIRRLASVPYGMMLVTGPTGSGKTTTLYAAITEINRGHHKIITIEDPVEYQLPGVLQIPVNEKKGLTFARGLRSILRHDPDKVMVGEIRDSETAQIAIQAALTGHLVFTTVHANNVFDVIGRFMHMGVDLYNFVSALNGVVAQRLVRVNCKHCARDTAPTPEVLAESELIAALCRDFRFRAGAGCGECRGSGYKGRRAIAELLVLNDELREAIVSRQPIRVIKELARAHGTRFLRDAALELVKKGETDLAEINRVTFVG